MTIVLTEGQFDRLILLGMALMIMSSFMGVFMYSTINSIPDALDRFSKRKEMKREKEGN